MRIRILLPPATWEQLLEDALKVQRGERRDHPGFYGFVRQGAQYEGLVCDFLEFAGADGGMEAVGGKVIVDTPRNREALRFMRDLIHNQVSEILQRRLNEALADRVSPGEALAAAQREIRGALSRYD